MFLVIMEFVHTQHFLSLSCTNSIVTKNQLQFPGWTDFIMESGIGFRIFLYITKIITFAQLCVLALWPALHRPLPYNRAAAGRKMENIGPNASIQPDEGQLIKTDPPMPKDSVQTGLVLHELGVRCYELIDRWIDLRLVDYDMVRLDWSLRIVLIRG